MKGLRQFLSTAVFVDKIDKATDIVGWGGWQNPMPKVENVARSIGCLIENDLSLTLNFRPRAEQENGVKVALNRHFIAKHGP